MIRERCPICKKPLPREADQSSGHYPFCSERCKMVDLGHWLSDDYAIPGEEIGREDEPKEPKKQ